MYILILIYCIFGPGIALWATLRQPPEFERGRRPPRARRVTLRTRRR